MNHNRFKRLNKFLDRLLEFYGNTERAHVRRRMEQSQPGVKTLQIAAENRQQKFV